MKADVPIPQSGEGRPLVSVIMSMRNSAVTVGVAVRSVQLQTLQDWELIVIDDGSADQSADIVGAMDDDRIRLVREPSNAGLATRLNQAVAISRGQFIARMDADDICFPERLARQVAYLQTNPQIDLLGSGAVVFTDDASLVGLMPVGITHDAITGQPMRGFPLPHPTWCGRAKWFRNNPYDAGLMKTQDQDLLLRTFSHSRFAALDDVLLAYRWNTLSLSKMLAGRRIFSGALWRHAQASGAFVPALGAIAMQVIKGSADIAATMLGLHKFAQRGRLKPVSPVVAQQWQGLQQQLCITKVIS